MSLKSSGGKANLSALWVGIAAAIQEPFYANQCWALRPLEETDGVAQPKGMMLEAYACSDAVLACTIGLQCSVCSFAMTKGRPIQQAGAVLEGVDGTWYALKRSFG